MSDPERAPAPWLRWSAPAALFALALAIRCLGWREVFGVVRVLPVGSDAYYHLRRIALALYQGPGSLDFDPYLAFPDGARPIWPPLFDCGVAALLRPFVAATADAGLPRVERLAMFVPPLLGALGVLALFALARRHFGWWTGLVAGAVLCVLSGHFWYSQLGFLDHHVAVALASTLVLAAGMELVAARGRGRLARDALRAAALGVAGGGALLLWPGSLLHVGLVHAGLLGWLVAATTQAARRGAWQLALAHAIALALLLPAGLASDWPQWGAASPVVLSLFQPWLFAAATGVCGGCALAWRSPRGEARGFRIGVLLALVALAAGASALACPDLLAGAGDAWRWLARAESFQSRVAESTPLLSEQGRLSFRVALVRLSGFALLLPFAWAALAWRTRQAAAAAPRALLLVWSAGLLVAALAQRRFFHDASVGVALLFAWTALELWRRHRSRAARTAVALASLALLAPTCEPYPALLANAWRALRGQKLEVGGAFARQRAQLELANWLRESTPPTAGWLPIGDPPEYGVLAPWFVGHVIEYAGRRPTVVDNFGDDLGAEAFEFAQRSYRRPEAQVVDELERRRIRYVVVPESPAFLGHEPPPRSLLRSLFERDGSGSETADGDPALAHHRLAFESKGLDFADRSAPPAFKVFEVVRGARIEGRAPAGALVSLRLGVFTNRGRRFDYASHAVADDDGVYRLSVPYANTGGPGVRTGPFYRLSCGGELGVVAVPESAVRDGGRVPAPDLCPGEGE